MSNKQQKGDKQVEGKNASRKRVLTIFPNPNDPRKLKSRFRWADELQ